MTTQHDFTENSVQRDRDEALASYLAGQPIGADDYPVFGYCEIAARKLGEDVLADDRDDDAILDLAEQLADEDQALKLRDDIADAAAEAERIYPRPTPDHEARDTVHDDDQDAREQVAAGATMLLQGDATLDDLAREHTDALAREREAMDRLRGAIIIAARQGMSESEIARRSDVTRMTVRHILGK